MVRALCFRVFAFLQVTHSCLCHGSAFPSCIAEGLRKAEAWVSMEMSQQFVKVDPQGIAITPQVPVPVA